MMMISSLSPLLLLLLLLLLATPTTAYLKYNEVRQKDSHNSYERQEGLLDQMIYHHCRTVEIDTHLGFTADLYSVYHDAGYFQSYSSFNRMRDGVLLLLDFHEAFPNHHVVTVFMDMKGGFKGDLHTPEGFDAIIGQLPLWTPAEVQGNASTIKEGMDQTGWPEIEDMRGKFIWVLTSGQDDYCQTNDECVVRKSFVAGKDVPAEEIGTDGRFIFYNQKATVVGDTGPVIASQGYVGRTWHPEDNNTPEKWEYAVEQQYQHITTDRVNYHRDPYTITHNAYGFPWQTTNGVDVSNWRPDEGAHVMYMYAPPEGGDAWGRQDTIHFRYNEGDELGIPLNEWVEYTTSISLSNSHCDQYAKAGIMMRQEDPRFPLGSGQYFGVVRTCRELIRVQYRERAYMLTVAKRLTPTLEDGIEQAKRIGIKVRYRYDGTDSYCEGYFKLEGRDPDDQDSYRLIAAQTFPNVRLTAHGIFVSSHYWEGNADGTPFKALFINSKRNGEIVTAADFDHMHGFNDTRAFGDGYFSDPNLPPLKSDDRRRQLNSVLLRGN